MKSADEIEKRLSEIESKLGILQLKTQEELAKPFFERRRNFCLFLDVERRVYANLIRELRWILHG